MKKLEDSLKYVQPVIKKAPLSRSSENSFKVKSGNAFKKFIYVSSFLGIGLFFNSCMVGYVETEPVYVEGVRPERPSNNHIWIDGNWVYSRQSRSYARQPGHWDRPVQGKSYVAGSWQSTSKGRHWTPGRWQKQK